MILQRSKKWPFFCYKSGPPIDLLNHFKTSQKQTMKFIAALIATAAAVKTHDDQWDADLDFELPALTAAAQALADTAVADESTLAGIADLTPEEALDLALWCTVKESCADNFEEVYADACLVDNEDDRHSACDAIEEMMYGLEDLFEILEDGASDFDSGSGSAGADSDVDSLGSYVVDP